MSKKALGSRKRKAPSGSPFGQEIREGFIKRYFEEAKDPLTSEAAWIHVYRLLLSIDRRTRLAHVYDGSHMQIGGNFHERAVMFTERLCRLWSIERRELPDHLDYLFKSCVKRMAEELAQGSGPVAALETNESLSDFEAAVDAVLVEYLADGQRIAVVREIGRLAEHHFTIHQKRQNLRGEGFEDTLRFLLTNVSAVPDDQLIVRKHADELPGFKRQLQTPGQRRPKVPKPDLAIVSGDMRITRWLITAKWSLRQDRIDTFAQEATFYRENKVQEPSIDFVLLTNEMDVARLKDVLLPPLGSGGFHFSRVYHVNVELLAAMQGERFKELVVYQRDGRLLSLSDFLDHAKQSFAVAPVQPKR